MRVQRLKKYRLLPEADQPEASSAGGNNRLIWADGPKFYFNKLALAFPQVHFDLISNVKAPEYTWCARVTAVTNETIADLDKCLHLFRRTLYVETSLDECFALGWHSRSGGVTGKPVLTALGQWIHMSKSYGADPDSTGDMQVAGLIAEQMAEFVPRHPLYRTCDGIVTVLPSNPEKAFDLPSVLAQSLEEDCSIPFFKEALFKVRVTAQMKYSLTLEEKLDNIAGSVGVRGEIVAGKRLLIVDDILESGITLAETARVLRSAGATGLYGLVATKTLKRKFP